MHGSPSGGEFPKFRVNILLREREEAQREEQVTDFTGTHASHAIRLNLEFGGDAAQVIIVLRREQLGNQRLVIKHCRQHRHIF